MPAARALPSELCLVRPPYVFAEPIEPGWWPAQLPPRGMALLWSPGGGGAESTLDLLLARPPGLPVFLVLPPPAEVHEIVPLLARLHELAPRAVLPTGPLAGVDTIRTLLATPSRPLALEATDYLLRRGLLSRTAAGAVRQILQVAGATRSITALSRRMYLSRRTLGRHFELEGIPVPSHWLQMARLLHVAARLQRERVTAFRAAVEVGYPDGFTMSNQMKRLIGCRPTEVRDCLGWEWVLESWIRGEAQRGGFDRERFREALALYLEGRELATALA